MTLQQLMVSHFLSHILSYYGMQLGVRFLGDVLCAQTLSMSCVRGGFKAVDRFNNSHNCAASSLFPDPSVLTHYNRVGVLTLPTYPQVFFFSSAALCSFILNIPPSFPPLFPFSYPPAENVTPRHKHSLLFQTRSLPPVFSVCLTLFLSFQPSFLHRTFSLRTPLLFLSSSVHFLVSVCRVRFSPVFPRSFSFPVSPLYSFDQSCSS